MIRTGHGKLPENAANARPGVPASELKQACMHSPSVRRKRRSTQRRGFTLIELVVRADHHRTIAGFVHSAARHDRSLFRHGRIRKTQADLRRTFNSSSPCRSAIRRASTLARQTGALYSSDTEQCRHANARPSVCRSRRHPLAGPTHETTFTVADKNLRRSLTRSGRRLALRPQQRPQRTPITPVQRSAR